MRALGCVALGILLSCLTALPLKGQGLADRVPADAWVYASWAGSDALGAAYEQSHLKHILDTLNLPQFLSEYVLEQMNRPGADAEKVAAARTLQEALGAMVKSPTALYVGPVDLTNPRQPMLKIALISRVGSDAGGMAEKLNVLLNRNGRQDLPPHGAVAAGDYLALYVGDASIQARLEGPAPADSLARSENYQKAIKQLGPSGQQQQVIVYVDAQSCVQGILGAIGRPAANGGGGLSWAQLLLRAIDASGLSGLQQMAWAGRFEGADWLAVGFVGMAERRAGVLSFLDNKPLSQMTLQMIPASATAAGVVRFNGERLLQDISDAAGQINERAQQQVETVYRQFYAFTGVDLQKELLPSLGDEFVYYASPEAAGDSMRGFTVVNKLKDPVKAASAISSAEDFINLLILQRDANSKAQFRPEQLPAPLEKVTAHVMAMEKVQPAWAIREGTFYFSLSVAGLQAALTHGADTNEKAGSEGAGLGANPAFVALRKSLGQEQISSFSFVDLPRAAPESYQIINQALSRFRAEHPDLAHPYTLPPLNRITPDLGPALKVCWSDGAGFHWRERAPFPLGSALGPVQMMFLRAAEMLRGARPLGPAPAIPGRGNLP